MHKRGNVCMINEQVLCSFHLLFDREIECNSIIKFSFLNRPHHNIHHPWPVFLPPQDPVEISRPPGLAACTCRIFLYLGNRSSTFQHQHDRALKTTVTLITSSKTMNSSKTTRSKAKTVSKCQARIISLEHPQGSQQTDCCLFRLLLPNNQQTWW